MLGGACIFEACHNEKCSGRDMDFPSLFVHSVVVITYAIPNGLGGGCKFIDPQTTLKEGHCDGERCTINGIPHPSVIRGQLSI